MEYVDYISTDNPYTKQQDERTVNVAKRIDELSGIIQPRYPDKDDEVTMNELKAKLGATEAKLSEAIDEVDDSFTDKLKAITGYSAAKTQTLKNVAGTLTWVDDTTSGGGE